MRAHFENGDHHHYKVSHVTDISELERLNLDEVCHAVLIDMRLPFAQQSAAIQYIGSLNSIVALVCLCQHHTQLREHQESIHLIDDYLVLPSIAPGELPTRISHAIRCRIKEHGLLIEQRLLQTLLDNVPDAIYFKDRNSSFLKINANMLQRYCGDRGWGLADIRGKNDFDLFTEEHAQQAFDDEQEIMRSGKPLIGKVEKETLPNGRVNWVTTTKMPLRDEHDRIIGTMGISRDITELKQIEEDLIRERTLLQTVIDLAPAGIFVKDLAGHYQVVNEKHSKYLNGDGPETIVGKTLYDLYPEEEAERIDALDRKIIETEEGVYSMVEHRVRADQTDAYILFSKVPFRDKSGKVTGLVGITQDITEQKLNELKLKNTIKTLNETQLQLIEAEKLKTVGRLAAGVAHEVKNPLAVVQLGIEYLQKKLKESTDAVGVLEDMMAATNKANHVILELLDYSTPHEISMIPKNINEVLNKVLHMTRHHFKKAQITVKLEFGKNLPPISMDESRLDQVFMNLLLNSVAAMPDGGHIRIRTYSERMTETGANVSGKLTEVFRIGDPMVIVEITDSGTGIESKNIDKIFDPFFSTKATGQGTGLGLSVTKSIVDMHRGLITLENVKGDTQAAKGARARIYFPPYSPQKKTTQKNEPQ